ncbi:MAG: methyltransferase domain-containing protein [Planctomycetes bacterium]|nr:methyltransferase domain-containing protein [Planctomycetota bacterium]
MFVCTAGHSFDVARSGYVNLLQPQDRRSLAPGDSEAAVQARRALFDAGFGAQLLVVLGDAVAAAEVGAGARAVDLGCGEGTILAALAARCGLEGFGIDISTPAIAAAAKRHAGITWIVSNADRRLPFEDRTLDLALSIDGRRNPAECARVLRTGAALVVAVPGADDLVELRTAVLGEARDQDRGSAVAVEFAAQFELVQRLEARDRLHLDAVGLEQLALATYRCGRTREREALQALAALTVTTQHTILSFRRRA